MKNYATALLFVLASLTAIAAPTQKWDFGNPDSEQQLLWELVNAYRLTPEAEIDRVFASPELTAGYSASQLATSKANALAEVANADKFYAGWRSPVTYRSDLTAQLQKSIDGINARGATAFDFQVTEKNLSVYTNAQGATSTGIEGYYARRLITGGSVMLTISGSIHAYLQAYHGPFVPDPNSRGIFADAVAFDLNGQLNPRRQLVGCVYTDANGNGRYDPGEGLAGVKITPTTGEYYAETAIGGGYVIDFPINAGALTVTASGGALTSPITKTATIGAQNAKLDFVYAPAGRPPQVNVPNGDLSTYLIDLSTRGIVASGERSLIAGVVISGPSSVKKKLLVLASGLNLKKWIPTSIGRPRIRLYQNVGGVQTLIAENNNWQTNQAEIASLIGQLGAQPFTPSSDPAQGDAGMVLNLPPGVYSFMVEPDPKSANQEGVGLIELYDASIGDGARLIDISARGVVETGDRQMIVGVVIGGSGQSRLMIRGVGPALKDWGVSNYLSDPSMKLYQNVSGNQQQVGANDDWWNSAQADQTAALVPQLGAGPLPNLSKDAVMLKRLSPGVYSAIISGSDSTPGVALAEIYEAYTN